MVSGFLPLWQVCSEGEGRMAPEASDDAVNAMTPIALMSSVTHHRIEGELVIACRSGVGLYLGEDKSPFQRGQLLLTSHRIWYFHSAPGSASKKTLTAAYLWLRLVDVASVSLYEGFGMWSHPKIIFRANDPSHTSPKSTSFKFSFRSGGMAEWHTALGQCLTRKLWDHEPAASTVTVASDSTSTVSRSTTDTTANTTESNVLHFTDRAGICGLQRQRQVEDSSLDALGSSALLDIDSVLTHASQLAQDIRKLRQQLDDGSREALTSSRSPAGAGISAADMEKLMSVEEALGVVTSHATLSQQTKLAGCAPPMAESLWMWMTHPPNAAILSRRPFVSMIDLYVTYRAKGGVGQHVPLALFSMALRDLSEAVATRHLTTTTGLWFSVVDFSCGVTLIRLCDDDGLVRVLEGCIGPRPIHYEDAVSAAGHLRCCVDATTLARSLRIDAEVAQELLDEMELDEVLCRDVRPMPAVLLSDQHGAVTNLVQYYWNLFAIH